MGGKVSTRRRLTKKQSSKNQPDEFIIDFHRNSRPQVYAEQNVDDIDQRRVVFVSLLGLLRTWRDVPSHVLYASVLVLPIEEKWIFSLSLFVNNVDCISALSRDTHEMRQFLRLLQWKQSQGLLFCMLDNVEQHCAALRNGDNALASPFWRALSHKLQTLFDPVTGMHYTPLNLSQDWWRSKSDSFKYNVSLSGVLAEMFFLTMKYDTISELIHQSYPDSLLVLKHYSPLPSPSERPGTITATASSADYSDSDEAGCPPDQPQADVDDDDAFVFVDYDAVDHDNVDYVDHVVPPA